MTNSRGAPGLTHLCSLGPKGVYEFWQHLLGEFVIGKEFEGDMIIRTLPTNLHQTFCKIIASFQIVLIVLRKLIVQELCPSV